MMNTFRSTAQTVTTKVSTAVSGLFTKAPTQHQFIQPYTRFGGCAHLSGIGEILERLYAKKEAMKKIGDEKGVQSPEFATYNTLEAILSDTNKAIVEFNTDDKYKPDTPVNLNDNLKDIYQLLLKLKQISAITEQQQAVLNSVTADKLNSKSTAATALMYAAPIVPALFFGPVAAIALGVTLAVAAKPATDVLIAQGVISFDAESKNLMVEYQKAASDATANLEQYFADNHIESNNQPAAVVVKPK